MQDVSDEHGRSYIDREVLKCLFTHPDKETILVLNKIDKLKNKKLLVDLVVSLTGGYLNNKQFIDVASERAKSLDGRRSKNSKLTIDYDTLFRKTAEMMNLENETKSTSEQDKSNQHVLNLIKELKECEDFLVEHLKEIKTDLPTTESIKDLETRHESKKSLITKEFLDQQLSAVEFKKDLMNTMDWHLYYRKLSLLGDLIRDKNHWPYFNQVFMVSAAQNDGVDELRRYLLSRARPNPWIFSRCLLTDQMPKDIAENCVRGIMLDKFNNEVPYEVGLEATFWELDHNDVLNIIILIVPGAKKGSFKRHLVILI